MDSPETTTSKESRRSFPRDCKQEIRYQNDFDPALLASLEPLRKRRSRSTSAKTVTNENDERSTANILKKVTEGIEKHGLEYAKVAKFVRATGCPITTHEVIKIVHEYKPKPVGKKKFEWARDFRFGELFPAVGQWLDLMSALLSKAPDDLSKLVTQALVLRLFHLSQQAKQEQGIVLDDFVPDYATIYKYLASTVAQRPDMRPTLRPVDKYTLQECIQAILVDLRLTPYVDDNVVQLETLHRTLKCSRLEPSSATHSSTGSSSDAVSKCSAVLNVLKPDGVDENDWIASSAPNERSVSDDNDEEEEEEPVINGCSIKVKRVNNLMSLDPLSLHEFCSPQPAPPQSCFESL